MFKSINRILSNTVIMVMVIILSLFYIFVVVSPILELSTEIEESEQSLEYKQSENENLKQTLEMISDEETRQKMARELYQLSEDGDILFKFPEKYDNE